jgi:hypothetical protein
MILAPGQLGSPIMTVLCAVAAPAAVEVASTSRVLANKDRDSSVFMQHLFLQ